MIPTIVALMLWILLVRGTRQCAMFCACLVVTGTVVASAMLLMFPAEGMQLNMLTIPRLVPWKGPFPLNVLAVGWELFRATSLLALCLLVGAVIAFLQSGKSERWSSFAGKDWVLVAFVGILHVPMSILGRVKMGGSANTFSPTLYFLLTAVCLLVVELNAEFVSKGRGRESRTRYKYCLMAGCTLLALICGSHLWGRIDRIGAVLGEHKTQVAYEYLRKTEEAVYFPTEPLAHLLADGELYHHAAAIHDREKLAGLAVTRDHIERHIPDRLSVVYWASAWGARYVRVQHFSEFSRKVEVQELKGYECFAKARQSMER
jgi:hypothetical protein